MRQTNCDVQKLRIRAASSRLQSQLASSPCNANWQRFMRNQVCSLQVCRGSLFPGQVLCEPRVVPKLGALLFLFVHFLHALLSTLTV